jgi:O-acetyl-ADP-ribose deacetylase (regulator of RNase III)
MATLAEKLHEVNSEKMKTSTVALPALGCGLGNLDWEKVKHIIRMGAQLNTKVRWTVYLQ